MHRTAVEPLARATAVAVCLALSMGGPARAGEVDVDPVLVRLTRGEKNALVTVRNRSAEATRYEVKVFAWDQAPDGAMKLTPTDDVVAFPAMLQIAPGEERSIRVGTLGAVGEVERSYRLLIEELPAPAKPTAVPGVRVLSRLSIPVFLTPVRPAAVGELAGLEISAGHVRFSLRNRGNVHLKPDAVRVRALDADGKARREWSVAAWYVLPGGERAYDVEVAAEDCAAIRSVAVEVTGLTPLRRSVAAGAGACGSP